MNNPVNHQPTPAENPAEATITLLIDLAQKGEIDPWDVDVIKVIDRFFQNDFNQFNLNQTNLPQSGQAFLWASMLVSFKADTLEALANEEIEEATASEETELLEEENNKKPRLPQKLENHIHRRGSPPPPKKRRVTLSELITQIRELASEMGEEGTKPPKKSRSQSQKETAQMISHLAHNENLTELTTELEAFLQQRCSELTSPQEWVTLKQLTAWWEEEKEEAADDSTEKANRVGIFWALLLLCSQSKVELSQEEFYQDLHLRFL